MPHGAGHHGGGGGHHHGGGGGFHHHHHRHGGGFHHHHHRHGGYVGYYSTPYYGYRRRPFSWVIIGMTIAVVIIVTTSVSVRYTASGDDDDLKYGPTDTRVVSISNALCQNAYINVGNGNSDYRVSLYALNSPPQLTGRESFVLNERPAFSYSIEFNFYYYHMPKGSNVSVDACVLSGQPQITYYMIKGQKQFEKWKDDYGHFEHRMKIRRDCGSGNDSYTYKVTSDDFYYLVFDSAVPSQYDDINITMHFERTRYEFKNDSVVNSCYWETIAAYGGCSITIPVSPTITLLQLSPSDGTEIDWDFEVYVDVGCSARIWMYFLISLGTLLGVVAMIGAFVALLYFFCMRPKKSAGASVTPASATVTASPANLEANVNVERTDAPLLHPVPPPTNPNYPQATVPPPQYGAALPPYKE